MEFSSEAQGPEVCFLPDLAFYRCMSGFLRIVKPDIHEFHLVHLIGRLGSGSSQYCQTGERM